MTEFTTAGLIIDRFPETREKLIALFRAAYGPDVLADSPESFAGNLVDIMASAIDSQNQLIQAIADSFNPNAALGKPLSDLVLLNGIRRKENVFSTCSVNVIAGTAATTIPAGSIVSDIGDAYQWETDVDVDLLPHETKPVSVTCKTAGAIPADVGTLVKIVTPVYSWESVNNTVSASPGQTEETDTELRIRRAKVATTTGAASVPAIYRAVSGIEAVESVSISENDTDAIDAYGNPPGSIWAIVKGGADDAIAAALKESIAGGISTVGSTLVDYVDPVNGKTYPTRFSRPVEIPVQMEITIRTFAGFPDDGDSRIREQIADFFAGRFAVDNYTFPGYGIGTRINRSELYSPIHSVPGLSVSELKISKQGNPPGDLDLEFDADEQGIYNDADVVIQYI